MDLKTELERLYEQYKEDLGDYAWMSETDRWAELVFCLLHQCGGKQAEITREAVAALQYLGLIDIDMLSAITKTEVPSEDAMVLAVMLRRQGFSLQASQCAVNVLSHAASALQEIYNGKIQCFLRKQGQAMVDELAGLFATKDLDDVSLRYAITLWLQNALSMPLSLAHPDVLLFCERHGARLDDLLIAADELDLNIAVVDDLVGVAQRTSGGQTSEEALDA